MLYKHQIAINVGWSKSSKQSGTVPLNWQTGVVVPLFNKGDRRVCSNYRGITLLSLPGKVYSRVLERRIQPIVEPQIQEEQCGFRPGCGTLDQLYTLRRVLEGSWELPNQSTRVLLTWRSHSTVLEDLGKRKKMDGLMDGWSKN